MTDPRTFCNDMLSPLHEYNPILTAEQHAPTHQEAKKIWRKVKCIPFLMWRGVKQACTYFSKTLEAHQNSRHLKGDIQQVSCRVPTNIKRHRAKLSRPVPMHSSWTFSVKEPKLFWQRVTTVVDCCSASRTCKNRNTEEHKLWCNFYSNIYMYIYIYI